MAGYTKADYDSQYAMLAEGEWGHPNTRAGIRIHYQRKVAAGFLHPRWDAIVALLSITVDDIIVIAGAGFGWSADYLVSLFPGLNIVGVDISDYIEAEKDTDDTTEIDEYITAGGLDPATGRGLEIRNRWASPGVNKATQIVLKEDMKTNQSRNKVRQALGNNTPTHIFTEDMISEFTDLEIAEWVFELDKLTNTVKIHIMSSERIRTAENVQALTGHRVLLVGGGRIQKDLP